jgi:hypothetical protein
MCTPLLAVCFPSTPTFCDSGRTEGQNFESECAEAYTYSLVSEDI